MISSRRDIQETTKIQNEHDMRGRADEVVRRIRRSPIRMQAWPQLRYHPLQAQVWKSEARYIVLACGRGSGKTELARRKLVTQLPVKKPWPNPLYFYALPTFMQAKRVAWKEILKLIPPEWIIEKNVMDLYIRTIFGSELYVVGLDRPQRIEGSQYDFGVVDECSDQKPKVFDLSIEPALTHKHGGCWLIGVPKRQGIGAPDFKRKFDSGRLSNERGFESYTWPSSDILSEEELKAKKESLDEKDFDEQYNASWIQPGGLIYYTFSDENIIPEFGIKTDVLYIGQDFNVSPMCWVMGQIVEGKLIIFDELFIRNTNTPECLEELYKRYGEKFKSFVFCGDAASKQRKTSASMTDYVLINNSKFKNKTVKIPAHNPPILDRYKTTNALILNAEGHRRLLVTRSCKHLINNLQNRAYKEGTSIPDDSDSEMGHITDALDYLIWQEFPMAIEQESFGEIGIHSFSR